MKNLGCIFYAFMSTLSFFNLAPLAFSEDFMQDDFQLCVQSETGYLQKVAESMNTSRFPFTQWHVNNLFLPALAELRLALSNILLNKEKENSRIDCLNKINNLGKNLTEAFQHSLSQASTLSGTIQQQITATLNQIRSLEDYFFEEKHILKYQVALYLNTYEQEEETLSKDFIVLRIMRDMHFLQGAFAFVQTTDLKPEEGQTIAERILHKTRILKITLRNPQLRISEQSVTDFSNQIQQQIQLLEKLVTPKTSNPLDKTSSPQGKLSEPSLFQQTFETTLANTCQDLESIYRAIYLSLGYTNTTFLNTAEQDSLHSLTYGIHEEAFSDENSWSQDSKMTESNKSYYFEPLMYKLRTRLEGQKKLPTAKQWRKHIETYLKNHSQEKNQRTSDENIKEFSLSLKRDGVKIEFQKEFDASLEKILVEEFYIFFSAIFLDPDADCFKSDLRTTHWQRHVTDQGLSGFRSQAAVMRLILDFNKISDCFVARRQEGENISIIDLQESQCFLSRFDATSLHYDLLKMVLNMQATLLAANMPNLPEDCDESVSLDPEPLLLLAQSQSTDSRQDSAATTGNKRPRLTPAEDPRSSDEESAHPQSAHSLRPKAQMYPQASR
jgi:hypothetical protein